MKTLKGLAIGIILGLLPGLWFGVNIGREQPVLSNPFAEPTLRDRLKQTGESLIEKSGEALEKGGQALQKKAQENQ